MKYHLTLRITIPIQWKLRPEYVEGFLRGIGLFARIADVRYEDSEIKIETVQQEKL